MTNKTIVQLIVGSFKPESVNGVNTSIRQRNNSLENKGYKIEYIRVDGFYNFLRCLFVKIRPKVVFIDSLYYLPSLILALKFKIKKKANIFVWSHGALNVYNNEYKKSLYLNFISIIFKYVDLFLLAGKSEVNLARKLSLNYLLFGNPVPINITRDININFVPNRLIYLGRFDYHGKGFDRMWTFLNNNIQYSLDIYGKGEIINIPIDLLDRVTINEPIYGISKYKIIQNSAALILLSRREGLPMSCIEALTLGVPIIVSEECNIEQDKGVFLYNSKFNLSRYKRSEISKNNIKKYSISNYSNRLITLIENKNTTK